MAIWIIAKLTIIEAVRRRIVLVGVLLGGCAAGISRGRVWLYQGTN